MAKSRAYSLPLFQAEPPALETRPVPARAAASEHLWLALHMHSLALDVFAPTREAVAVAAGEGSHRCLVACNAEASRQGVAPGMGLNAAFAVLPELRVLEQDARRQQRALKRLAGWAGQYTSWVSLVAPDALLLEIRGSLRLFGGLPALQEGLGDGLSALGYQAYQGVAPTPLGALWLARCRGSLSPLMDATQLAGVLGRLPLSCTGWPEKLRAQLHHVGARSIGDCLRLPRDGFARRFGQSRLRELDRALGRHPDPRAAFNAPGRFRGEVELPVESEQTARLLPALERLVQELAGLLRARQCGIESLRLCLLHTNGPATRIDLRRLSPGRDGDHFLGLLGERLDRVRLPAPVIALRLESGVIRELGACGKDLLGENACRASGIAPELVERLRARLGETAVYGVCLVPEYRPEASWRRSRDGELGAELPRDWRRPLWILDEPIRLAQHGEVPWHDGILSLKTGPERIETGWWDGRDVARDYYQAMTPRGVRLWVYQDRKSGRHWYMHGVFG